MAGKRIVQRQVVLIVRDDVEVNWIEDEHVIERKLPV